ncbi:hypothetical protein [Streptomyces sp. NPDC002690]
MAGVGRASEALIAERDDLAGSVTEALVTAWFPVHRDVNRAPAVMRGALVPADPGDDFRGGIFVDRLPDPSLAPDALDIVRRGETSSPALRQFAPVTERMYATSIAIPGSAGFRAGDADDDMSPFLIRVEE